jgi:sulfite reductase (NADPH) hemoprotein beta-component
VGFRVLVGGGMGRTPVIASVIRELRALRAELVNYLDAIAARLQPATAARDNMYKARIKILVQARRPDASPTRSKPRVRRIVERRTGAPRLISEAEFDALGGRASCRPHAHWQPQPDATRALDDAA